MPAFTEKNTKNAQNVSVFSARHPDHADAPRAPAETGIEEAAAGFTQESEKRTNNTTVVVEADPAQSEPGSPRLGLVGGAGRAPRALATASAR